MSDMEGEKMTKIELISQLVGKELNDVALVVDIFDEMHPDDKVIAWRYINDKMKKYVIPEGE